MAAAIVAAAVIVVVLVRANRAGPSHPTVAAGTSCTSDAQTDPGSEHVGNPSFGVNPPAGGDHLATPAPPGTFPPETTPPDGKLVHSLEHGYVIVWYRPDASAPPQALVDLAAGFSRDVLLVSRPSLPVPTAATAWHHRLLCTQLDSAALRSFIETYRNQGPERIAH